MYSAIDTANMYIEGKFNQCVVWFGKNATRYRTTGYTYYRIVITVLLILEVSDPELP